MKVVLLEDLPGKGKAGEIREVSKGYAKNFLLPRGLALVATATVMKQVESGLEKQKLEQSIDREKLIELAQQIEGKEIRLKARIGAGERLFGSITAADVAEELSRSVGSVIDKRQVEIEKPFRQAGSYDIAIKLAGDIRPKITVVVEEEEKKEVEPEKKVEKKQPKAKEQQKEAEAEQEADKKQPKAKEKKQAKGKGKEEGKEKKEDKE